MSEVNKTVVTVKGSDYLRMEDVTREVGDRFYYKGTALMVVQASMLEACFECYFRDLHCGDSICIHGVCNRANRTDNSDVYFEQVR